MYVLDLFGRDSTRKGKEKNTLVGIFPHLKNPPCRQGQLSRVSSRKTQRQSLRKSSSSRHS